MPEQRAEELKAITANLGEALAFLDGVRSEMARVVVGQEALIDGLLTGLLSGGHVLLEGLPGLAKSLTVQTLATALGGTYRRVQFTPDLLPSDVLGTQIFRPDHGDWVTRQGPIFGNFVLADEINRAPPKVQAALLEAMEERQVTLAGETHPLPSPFLVLATQNPVDLEGTYPLPEAQVDRFLLKVLVHYPTRDDEPKIMRRMMMTTSRPTPRTVASPEQVLAARRAIDTIYVDDKLLAYITELVFATREPDAAGLGELRPLLLYGASPRASIALVRAARAQAALAMRPYVLPQDVKHVAPAVLRHRVMTTYEAEAEGMGAEDVIQRVLDTVAIP